MRPILHPKPLPTTDAGKGSESLFSEAGGGVGKLRLWEQVRGLESQSCQDGVQAVSKVKSWNTERTETVEPQV